MRKFIDGVMAGFAAGVFSAVVEGLILFWLLGAPR